MHDILMRLVATKRGVTFVGRTAGKVSRGLRLAVVAVCKAALLLSMFSLAVESESRASESEGESKVESEWLYHCEGSRRRVNSEPSRIQRALFVRGRGSAAKRQAYLPRSAGHRLNNGLLAPMTC